MHARAAEEPLQRRAIVRCRRAERTERVERLEGLGVALERLVRRAHLVASELGPGGQHAAGWETYLARLDAHLAGGFLSEEEAHGRINELLERYHAVVYAVGAAADPSSRAYTV